MANTLKLGAGKWATGTDTVLAFNDENNNFKPLPFSFSRASSATVVNQSGLIETVGSGEPRIDFLGNTKGALLLEPTRTNYVPNSENMSAWNLQANIINSLNTDVIAPDGTLNGWKASRNINSNGYTYMTGVGLSTNTIYTASIWLKAYDVTICDAVVFNFHPNSFTSNSTTFSFETGIASGDGKVEKYSNGWYRLSLTSISNSTIGYFDIGLQPYLNGSNNWGGQDGDTLFYAYGTQLEVGSYATSYIPTSGQSGGVTRVADACNNENLNVDYSGDYTLYLEHETLSITEYNQFQFRQETSISYIFRVGNLINVGSGLYSTTNTIGFNKFALSVGSDGSYSFYKNGSLLSSGSGLNANLETLRGDATGMSIKDIKLYNTRLSNSELAALTQ
jgi:hypothetical protein